MILTNRIRLNYYPFHGWDWTELCEAWNVYMPKDFYIPDPENKYGFHPTCYEIDPIKWYLTSVMKGYMGNESTRPMKKCAKDLRKFLALLGDKEKGHSYSGPMWLGMSLIDDDWTLLSHTYDNIGSMWD